MDRRDNTSSSNSGPTKAFLPYSEGVIDKQTAFVTVNGIDNDTLLCSHKVTISNRFELNPLPLDNPILLTVAKFVCR